MRQLSIGMIQVDPGNDKDENVSLVFELVDEAVRRGAEFVVLPESFHVRGPSEVRFATAEPIPGPLYVAFAESAKRHGVTLLAGSYNEAISRQDRLYNTSLLFGPDGQCIATYRKIHLFDATIDGQVVARESSRNLPGDVVVSATTPFGHVGMTICYDLRFPELYRALALRGAEILLVPSNFALYTGRDHWEPLLRARAIENGAFVVAPATVGQRGGFQSYGRSMVVDPWGTVVACAPDEVGVTMVTIDLDQIALVRARLPSLTHRRPDVYQLDVPSSSEDMS